MIRLIISLPIHIIRIALGPSVWFFLTLCGWDVQKSIEASIKMHEKYKKIIVIFSHTSLWDFWLNVFIYSIFPGITDSYHIVCKPQLFESWFGFIFRNGKYIAATRSENTGKGFVQNTIDKFKNLEEFRIAISPEGKFEATKWRSGYYHLAKGLNVPIIVAGFDYEKRTARYETARYVKDYDSKEEMEKVLMDDMSGIVPRNMDKSFALIKGANIDNIYAIDPLCFSHIMFLIAAYYIAHVDIFLAISCMGMFFCSLAYHVGQEKNKKLGYITKIYIFLYSIYYLLALGYIGMLPGIDFIWLYLGFISTHSYILCQKAERTSDYIWLSTFFNVIFGSFIIYPLL